MGARRRFLLLAMIMVVVAVITTATAITLLYRTAVGEEKYRLVETAQSQARLIEAVARFDAVYSQDFPQGSAQATLSQIVDAHSQYRGFGETGEFTLARLEADSIIFLLSHRHFDLESPQPLPINSQLAEPMSRALSGQSGTVIGLDYRGKLVLAAYEPVGELDLGIVAKIDLSEVRAPFWRAGSIAGLLAILVIAAGGWQFMRISNPIAASLEASLVRLQKSEAKTRALIEAIPDMLFILDGQGTFLEYIPTDESDSFVPPEQFLGRTVEEVLPADLARQMLQKYKETLATGKPTTLEYSLPFEDGHKEYESRHVKLGANKILGIVRDISKSKQAEEALRASEEMYRLLFNSGDDAILVYYPTEEGPSNFIEVNDVVCDRLGYSRTELLKMSPKEISIINPEQLKIYYQQLEQDGRIMVESLHRTKAGVEIPVEINAHRFDLNGQPAILSVARDITERRRAEEERERLLASLEEKNTDLEQIIRISSHDLRSPLINIEGFAGILGRILSKAVENHNATKGHDDGDGTVLARLDNDARNALEHITKSCHKMEQLIAGLLRLSRVGKMDLEVKPLDMNTLVKGIAQGLSYQIEQSGASLEIADLPPCKGDQLQLGQVITNLLDNALKFLDADRTGKIRVSGQHLGPIVEYCIEDNGIGIASEYHDMIFRLFHRMHPAETTGEGVGLTIIRKIVARHGGQVRLESVSGEGTRFFISLPTESLLAVPV